MATADLDGFRQRFPEFSEVENQPVENAVEEAALLHTALPLATLYCAAHLLALNKLQSDAVVSGGEIVSENSGPVGAQYVSQAEAMSAGAGSRDAFYTSTNYGRRFLALEKRSPGAAIGAMVVA